jgi:hypothetical protein
MQNPKCEESFFRFGFCIFAPVKKMHLFENSNVELKDSAIRVSEVCSK